MSDFVRVAAFAAWIAAAGAFAAGIDEPPADQTAAVRSLPPADQTAAVKSLLQSKYPKAEIIYFAKSPYFGLYEAVFADDQTVYTDDKVTYIIVGDVIDPDKKISLSGKMVSKLHAIQWSALPLDLAIKTVKGDGSRQLAVFADADCPFCRRLEGELKSVGNVTVYTFLFPIESLHPDAIHKSKLIWCSADRAGAWKAWIIDGRLPKNSPDCDVPMPQLAALGDRFHVIATPTLVFTDGHTISGAPTLDRLESELDSVNSGAEAKDAARADGSQ